MKKFLKLFLFTLILFNLTPAIANTLNVSTASYSIVINGEKWKPDNPIIAINGKTYIPLTEIAELLDVDVSWNEKKRQVEINKEDVSSEDDEKNEEEEFEEETDEPEEETYSSYFEWLMDWYGFNEEEAEEEEEIAVEDEEDDFSFSLDWLWSWDDDSQVKVSYETGSETENSSSNTTSSSTSSQNYVASKSGSKYHLSSCSSAKKIKSANKTYFASESKAEAAGYSACSICIK